MAPGGARRPTGDPLSPRLEPHIVIRVPPLLVGPRLTFLPAVWNGGLERGNMQDNRTHRGGFVGSEP